MNTMRGSASGGGIPGAGFVGFPVWMFAQPRVGSQAPRLAVQKVGGNGNAMEGPSFEHCIRCVLQTADTAAGAPSHWSTLGAVFPATAQTQPRPCFLSCAD